MSADLLWDTPLESATDVMGAAARTTPSFEDLYQTHWSKMVRLALLMVDDRASAEDVAADAYLDLHRAWSFLADPDRAAGYLRVAVVNRSRSLLRRRRTARAWVAPQDQLHPSAEDDILIAEQRQEVIDVVRSLPERQREVVVLRYWAGLDEAEIAEALGVSRGTVKSTASRALAAVGQVLGVRGGPPVPRPRPASGRVIDLARTETGGGVDEVPRGPVVRLPEGAGRAGSVRLPYPRRSPVGGS